VTRRNQSGARRRVNPLIKVLRLGLGAAGSVSIAQMVQAAAAQYGVDPTLALAVAQKESGLNPSAVNPTTGAAGVMQLMPATAAALGVTNSLDPAQNIPAGVRYLSQLLNSYGGDVGKALAAYDWGLGNVNNAVAQYGSNWLSVAPSETQAYVASITGQAAPAPSQPVLTIDASTGLPVTDSTDVNALPSINEAGVVSLPAGGVAVPSLVAYAALGLGAWLLYDTIRDW
jgi:transglycosylase-like protein with SLT domain